MDDRRLVLVHAHPDGTARHYWLGGRGRWCDGGSEPYGWEDDLFAGLGDSA